MIVKCEHFLGKDLPEQLTNNETKPLSLSMVANDGIYQFSNNSRICHYNFGEISRVIYINNYLLIINFNEGKMSKYNTKTNEVTTCSYPDDYLFETDCSPTVNETIDGHLITIGGYLITNRDSNEVKIYNINTDVWSDGTSLPCGVSDHATVVDDDDIYVIGGECRSGDDDHYEFNKVIRYRYAEWNTLEPLLNNRCDHIALLRDTYMYVYGGNYCGSIECYNIITGVWKSINTDIFDNVYYNNSVCDKNVMYMYDYENSIYSICLVNYTKTLLYNKDDVYACFLVLMNL